VLPAGLNLGAKLGDYAVVIRPETGAITYAVYADVGPAGKIGEGSIALTNALGVPSSAKTGGTGSGIIYLVYLAALTHSQARRRTSTHQELLS
jgi:hypothetical protein